MAKSNSKSRRREDYGFHLEYRTRWTDNDMYSHMNNSVYMHLFDSIINAYLISHCGLDPGSSNQVGLVVSSYCEYFASVAYPSVLDLGLRVVKIGKSSVSYEVGVFERGDETVKACGGYTHVFVEKETRKAADTGTEEQIRLGLERLLGLTRSRARL